MSSRLSKEQWEAARRRAAKFRRHVVERGREKGFAEVFRLAAALIEEDVDGFCDQAERVFEEIEAFGQEPQLDDEWLDELTGEKDNFYFSTDNLVQGPEMLLPGNRGKGRKSKAPDEKLVVKAVEDAIDSLEDALSISHSENIENWVENIKHALEDGRSIEFWQLQHITLLKPSALFLGLLLGHEHWKIRQDSFYGDVTITLNK